MHCARACSATIAVPVYARAARNCPWVGVIWGRYLNALERQGVDDAEHAAAYQRATGSGLQVHDLTSCLLTLLLPAPACWDCKVWQLHAGCVLDMVLRADGSGICRLRVKVLSRKRNPSWAS